MAWYYNSNDGAVEDHNPTTFLEAHLPWLGWHGPFNTQQDALNYYNENKAAHPDWHAPTGLIQQVKEIPQTLSTGINTAGQEAQNAIAKDIFGNVNLQSWFIRIAEILLGLVLVGVSIAKLTGTANVISKAVKVGALA